MRTYLFIFLAIMLCLNATYVTAVGICSTLEESAGHAAHFGHHDHQHSDDHAQNGHIQDDLQVSIDESGNTTTASDHHHHHVHPSFSSILPDIIGVMQLTGSSPLVAALPSTLISVTHVLLERPPRVSLA